MKIKEGTLVLVVDGAKMLILCNRGGAFSPDLKTVTHREIDNPPSRDQLADAPGVGFSSMGTGRTAYETGDPHQAREDLFAAEAVAALAQAAAIQEGDIIVVAPPRTLGVLRAHYSQTIKDRLIEEIDKDLTGHPVAEISRLLGSIEA